MRTCALPGSNRRPFDCLIEVLLQSNATPTELKAHVDVEVLDRGVHGWLRPDSTKVDGDIHRSHGHTRMSKETFETWHCAVSRRVRLTEPLA
jgi:hypothetical protein